MDLFSTPHRYTTIGMASLRSTLDSYDRPLEVKIHPATTFAANSDVSSGVEVVVAVAVTL